MDNDKLEERQSAAGEKRARPHASPEGGFEDGGEDGRGGQEGQDGQAGQEGQRKRRKQTSTGDDRGRTSNEQHDEDGFATQYEAVDDSAMQAEAKNGAGYTWLPPLRPTSEHPGVFHCSLRLESFRCIDVGNAIPSRPPKMLEMYGVYAVWIEKEDGRIACYIGSGTRQEGAVAARIIGNYERGMQAAAKGFLLKGAFEGYMPDSAVAPDTKKGHLRISVSLSQPEDLKDDVRRRRAKAFT